MNKIKQIHFIGVKGVGMAPLGVLAKEAGFIVTGCDVSDAFITDDPLKNAAIYPWTGFSKEHLKSVDLVITTGAHGGKKNPEVQEAHLRNIPVLMQGQAVGEFMSGKILNRHLKGISVAGCHGKTTTTALIATLLRNGGYDPSFIIGTGAVPSLGSSGHFGTGVYFVAEADEYATEPTQDKTPKFLWQFPEILVLTNIEFDHPDVYDTIEQINDAYAKLIKNVHKKGIIIANGDDQNIRKILKSTNARSILFGFNSNNDYRISNVSIKGNKTFFTLRNNSPFFKEFCVNALGVHNAFNATSAMLVARQVGMSDESIQEGLFKFQGTKRRLEYKGELVSGAQLYDDYAHHPTEIKATLGALHELYPNKKIIAIFQPHTYSRTKMLFEEFIGSFNHANLVILTSIYPSKREKPDASVSSERLAHAIGKMAIFVRDLSNVVQYIKEKHFDSTYCLVTMGAGDIYQIDEQLRQENLL